MEDKNRLYLIIAIVIIVILIIATIGFGLFFYFQKTGSAGDEKFIIRD